MNASCVLFLMARMVVVSPGGELNIYECESLRAVLMKASTGRQLWCHG